MGKNVGLGPVSFLDRLNLVPQVAIDCAVPVHSLGHLYHVLTELVVV